MRRPRCQQNNHGENKFAQNCQLPVQNLRNHGTAKSLSKILDCTKVSTAYAKDVPKYLGAYLANELEETRMPKCREPTHIPVLGTCLAEIMKMKILNIQEQYNQKKKRHSHKTRNENPCIEH